MRLEIWKRNLMLGTAMLGWGEGARQGTSAGSQGPTEDSVEFGDPDPGFEVTPGCLTWELEPQRINR